VGDWLGGLRVRAAGHGGGSPVTEPSGTLLDQAAVLGVLVTLYDLGLSLLAVACRAAQRPPSAAVGAGPPAGPRRARAMGGWDWQP
jgi:hypothetical protein